MVQEEDIDKMTHECFEKLCHAVNGGAVDDLSASMYRTFQRQHRYLQGEFIVALWKFFNLYGDLGEDRYDQRNEWAVKAAKKWAKNFGS
jgi:hypothetical protein